MEDNLVSEHRKQKEALSLKAKPEYERKKSTNGPPQKIHLQDVVTMVIKDVEAKDEEERSIAQQEKQEEEQKKNGPRLKLRDVGRAVVAIQRMSKQGGVKATQGNDAETFSEKALAMGGGDGIRGGEELGANEAELGEISARGGLDGPGPEEEGLGEAYSSRGAGLGQFFNVKTGEELQQKRREQKLALTAMFDRFNESIESHHRGKKAFDGLEEKYGAGWSDAVKVDLLEVQNSHQDATQKLELAREAAIIIAKQLTEIYIREEKMQKEEEERRVALENDRRAKEDDNKRKLFEEQMSMSMNVLARSRSL